MEFSWKFPDDDVIITDDGYKFSNASKLRPTTKYLLFKCSHYGCRAKITMSLDKSKPLTIDFQHSHGSSEPSISKKKSSVSLQQKSIEKSKPSPIQKITKSTKISSPFFITMFKVSVRKGRSLKWKFFSKLYLITIAFCPI